tara:strand:- start:589 stop:807 length:219 start_codon:yes stop_codon:yes gene_type:complete
MMAEYFRLPNGVELSLLTRFALNQVLFLGSATGNHSLVLSESTPDRIAAHWLGYKEKALRNYWGHERKTLFS